MAMAAEALAVLVDPLAALAEEVRPVVPTVDMACGMTSVTAVAHKKTTRHTSTLSQSLEAAYSGASSGANSRYAQSACNPCGRAVSHSL